MGIDPVLLTQSSGSVNDETVMPDIILSPARLIVKSLPECDTVPSVMSVEPVTLDTSLPPIAGPSQPSSMFDSFVKSPVEGPKRTSFRDYKARKHAKPLKVDTDESSIFAKPSIAITYPSNVADSSKSNLGLSTPTPTCG